MAKGVDFFKGQLAEQRERYNTLFALARRVRPRLDGELFSQNLRSLVAPIVAAGVEDGEEGGEVLVDSLYETCLELTGSDLFARSPASFAVWARLLPASGGYLLDEPQKLPAALTNAAYNIESEPGGDWSRWLDSMLHLRPYTQSATEWLQLGQVLSWTCGLAYFRESALHLAKTLKPQLLEPLYENFSSLQDDVWAPVRPAKGELALIRQVGAFVGFGGKFRLPPLVASVDEGRFVVLDGTDEWVLSCDGFGSTLKSGVEYTELPPDPELQCDFNKGRVQWRGLTADLEHLAPLSSAAASGDAVVVTSERSHRLSLLLPGR